MRVSLCLVLLALAACGDPQPVATTPHVAPDVGLLTVHQARCAACHSLGGALDTELRGDAALPLASFANRVDAVAGLPDLSNHFSGFGMSTGDASDLRAWLRSLGEERAARNFAEVSGGAIPRGEQLVRELACGACHAPAELELSQVTDHAQLTAFLAKPEKAGAVVAHVPLSGSEASAIAAWLLRGQKQDGARTVGFGYECFEVKISNGNWPDVTGLEVKARGVVDKVSTEAATRKDNYALQFESTLEVPADGEWSFATRSDDGSWLWIDGELVVDNAGLKPATRKDGRINLSKGAHQLRVAFTQGGGGAELKVLWAGPGVDEQELPGTSASTSVVRLVPKAMVATAPAEEAVARGRSVARAARCDACHQVDESAFEELPAPTLAKAWAKIKIGEGTCDLPAGPAIFDEVGQLPAKLEVATKLKIALKADGCLSCHVRDGEGGLPKAVRKHLREVEDIGEEGLVPPDLSSVGRRLRPAWLERVVREGHKSRDYVVMRMPAYGDAKAKQYAEWFNAVDAVGVVDEEPPFSAEAAALGRTLAGT
ncbi:MAG: cytochrome c551/c552, partial [Planctomycetota bacterium]